MSLFTSICGGMKPSGPTGPVVISSALTDGHIESSSGTYANARSGSGTVSAFDGDYATSVGQGLSGGVYSVLEVFVSFDLFAAGLANGATISSAVLSFEIDSDEWAVDFTVEARQHDWGASVLAADFVPGDSLASKTLLASLATATLEAYARASFAESGTAMRDAVAAALAADGVLRMVLSSSRTRLNSAPSNGVPERVPLYLAEGYGSPPRLTVVVG